MTYSDKDNYKVYISRYPEIRGGCGNADSNLPPQTKLVINQLIIVLILWNLFHHALNVLIL